MAWNPTPQRRVLLENASFVYAFGNTKYFSLFREGAPSCSKYLLLGFGDVRNVLATAAACAAQLAGQPRSSSSSSSRELLFDLCDMSLLNVARGLLLLHLASTLDPSSPKDLHFFWGVSYCLRLPAAHSQRLAAAAAALLQQPGGGLRAQLGGGGGDAAKVAAVERVIRGWARAGGAGGTGGGQAPPQRAVGEVEAERRRLVMARLSTKTGTPVRNEAELRGVFQGLVAQALANLLPWPPRGGHRSLEAGMGNQALIAECMEYFMTGTIYPTAVTAASGQPEGSGSGGAGADAWAVNPTLLHPSSGKWLLHYGALPFLGFLPLDPTRHAGIASTRGPRALTEACLEDLARLLRGWQACRAQCRRVQTRFWCCEALGLCSGGQLALAGEQYDAVDTSNLSDHVGLINLLAVVAPRLRQAPHARLYTGHMLWITGTRSLTHYVRLGCGADPRLLPTLLGLRLMNDPQYGLELPRSTMANYGKTDVNDVLEWAPARLQAAAAPIMTEGDGIAAALKAWGDLACSQKSVPLTERSGLCFASPLTLLHLLGGLAGRVRGVLPAGTASWRQVADSLAALCSIPQSKRMELRALCCWALQRPPASPAAAAPPGAAGAGAAAAPAAPLPELPVIARGRLPLSGTHRELARKGLTPLLAVHLVHIPPGCSMESLMADLMAMAQGGLQGAMDRGQGVVRNLHIIDVVQFDPEREEVAFLLPPDHGMSIADAAVSLLDGRTAQALTPGALPLTTLTLSPCTQLPPAALSASLHRLLREAAAEGAHSAAGEGGTSSAGPGSSSGSRVQLSQGVQLRRLAEHADRFEAELAVDASLGGTVSSSGMGLEFPGAPLGGGACQVLKLNLAQPATLLARITFPWPIDSNSASIRVRRSARTITASLPKSPLWPSDRAWQPKLEVDSLPDWGTGPAAQDELGTHMSCQLTHADMEAKTRGAAPGTSGDPMFDVKESLQALFVRTFQGSRAHGLRSTAAAPDDDDSVILFVHSAGRGGGAAEPASPTGNPTGSGVRRLPDGRPLLHVSYVDHEVAKRLFPTEESKAAPMARFSNVIRTMGGFGAGFNRVNCTPQELSLLRFLLARNAALMRVPSWQSQLLELPSEWGASFLVPAYADWVAEPGQGDLLADTLAGLSAAARARPTAPPWPPSAAAAAAAAAAAGAAGANASASSSNSSRRSQPGSGTGRGSGTGSGTSSGTGRGRESSRGSGSGGASLTAVRHKEAGNALFKQGEYAAAAHRYRRGLEAQQGQQAGEQQAQQQLLLDLHHNLALALIRQAEAEPAAAPANLAAAEASCTAALQLEAGNSKALYRRALARYKQGRAAAAQADLAALPGTAEGAAQDAAVAQLRLQVQAVLRQ